MKHSMPFLSRNLLYVRRANGSFLRKKTKGRLDTAAGNAAGKDSSKGKKKLNLLLDIFRHRTVMYNDALLDSPRRATRKLMDAEIKSVSSVNAKDNKRKRNDTDDESSEESVGD